MFDMVIVKPFWCLLTLVPVSITSCKSVVAVLCQCCIRSLWFEEHKFYKEIEEEIEFLMLRMLVIREIM